MQKPLRKKKRDIGGIVLTVLFSLVCILYVMPIVEVLINSFKTHSAINTDTLRPAECRHILQARATMSRA